MMDEKMIRNPDYAFIFFNSVHHIAVITHSNPLEVMSFNQA